MVVNSKLNSGILIQTTGTYVLRSALILLICIFFIGPLRQISPLIVVEGTPFYIAYLPVALLIAVTRIFGIRYIPVLLLGVYLVFRIELHLNQLQTMVLAMSVVFPLGFSLILLKRYRGNRYRAAAVNGKVTLHGLFFLGVLYPILTQLSLYAVGVITKIPDDFQYYFSVKEIMLLLRNMQSLMLPAMIFTPVFYHLIRMLSSKIYMKKFLRLHVAKIFNGESKVKHLLWLTLISGLFILYASVQNSAVLSSYMIPLLFLVFIYGFINLDYTLVSLLWGATIYVVIRYDYGFIQLIQKDKLLICFSSLLMVFTIANTWLSAVHHKMTNLIGKLYATTRRDLLTQIPNLQALADYLKIERKDLCLCYIRLLSIDKIEKHLGFTFKANMKRVLYSQLRRLIGNESHIFSCPNSDLVLLLPSKNITSRIAWLHTQIKSISVLNKNLTFEFSCGYSWVQTENITDLEGAICGLEYLATHGGEGKISALQDNTVLVEQHTSLDINKLENIRQALKNNKIQLYIQEISGVNNNDNYWEVLCRLKHNDVILTPDIFLPVITEFDLASYFDFKVIETLLKSYQFYGTKKFSFNILPETLGKADAAETILELFDKYQVNTGRFVIEVTEEQLFFNEKNALQNIRTLREAGFLIAIDDFGRGYANFERLKTLEADILKIDGLFIKNIVTNETDAEIVRSITRIARLKGMEVVAEYVESQEHADILVGMNIDYLQGYYIGKPIPLLNITE